MKHLTFDDILILPQFSTIKSRKDVNISSKLCENLTLNIPIISANMNTITEDTMANKMFELGGLGILHRFCTIEENIKMVQNCNKALAKTGVSIGLGNAEKERAEALYFTGARIFCIDVAHGAQLEVVNQTKWLREKYGNNIQLIVGNFATNESIETFDSYLDKKPDVYKIGIGPGSVCSTRIKTGIGVPQLHAIRECSINRNTIADGGIRSPGDVVKALAMGAKAVMIGKLIAGTDETPGEIRPYQTYKNYKGSASENYGNGWKTSEGIETTVLAKGPVEPIIKDIEGGIRSGMTYTNSRNLDELRKNAKFIEISEASKIENTPHIKV